MDVILEWSGVDQVFLDLDGTLLDLHFDNHFWLEYVPECYAHRHGLSLDEAEALLMGYYGEVRGKLDWYCVDYWSRKLDLDIAMLKGEVADRIAIRSNVVSFLDGLRQGGKRVVLVTNAHQKSLSLKMEVTGISGLFDRMITSHELEMAKEHAGFWKAFHGIESFDPERTLFIDDNEEVLRRADEHGIRYLLSIKQPDSKQKARTDSVYPMVHDFAELMPIG